MFRFHVLGLLRQGVPRHGYWIVKAYRERTGGERNAGSVYRELQELESRGLVRSAKRGRGSDARRVPYEITQSGLEAFEEWFTEIPPPSIANDREVEARALFLGEVGTETARSVLDSWERDLALRQLDLEFGLRRVASGTKPAAPTFELLLQRRLRHIVADRVFVDELRERNGLPHVESDQEVAPRLPHGRRKTKSGGS